MYYEDDKTMLLQLVSIEPTETTYVYEALLNPISISNAEPASHQSRAIWEHHFGAFPDNSDLNG